MRARLAIILAALALVACKPSGPPPPDKADMQAARQAALQLDIRIHRELLSRLEYDEPMAVYVGYRDKVFGWTEEISNKSGYKLKRTALAVRNPKNTPDKWEIAQLETFAAMIETGLDPAAMEFGEIITEGKTRTFRWIAPIPRSEDCNVCHSDAVPPDVLLQITNDYPLDETVIRSKPLGDAPNRGAQDQQDDDPLEIGAYSVTKVLK